MALINCPDCGTEISDQAPRCGACGRPVNDPRRGFVGAFGIMVAVILAVLALRAFGVF